MDPWSERKLSCHHNIRRPGVIKTCRLSVRPGSLRTRLSSVRSLIKQYKGEGANNNGNMCGKKIIGHASFQRRQFSCTTEGYTRSLRYVLMFFRYFLFLCNFSRSLSYNSKSEDSLAALSELAEIPTICGLHKSTLG